jgi:hypothetical protein
MHLVGNEADDGAFVAKGSYAAEDQTWGWSIGFKVDKSNLVLRMENITPDGVAEWAVEATYLRG